MSSTTYEVGQVSGAEADHGRGPATDGGVAVITMLDVDGWERHKATTGEDLHVPAVVTVRADVVLFVLGKG